MRGRGAGMPAPSLGCGKRYGLTRLNHRITGDAAVVDQQEQGLAFAARERLAEFLRIVNRLVVDFLDHVPAREARCGRGASGAVHTCGVASRARVVHVQVGDFRTRQQPLAEQHELLVVLCNISVDQHAR